LLAGRFSVKGPDHHDTRQRAPSLRSAMTWMDGLCEDRCVRARSTLVVALCLMLVAVWGSGVHVHLSHEHVSGVGHAEHDVHITEVSEDAPDHFAAHLHHGDIDLDGTAKAIAKAPTLKLPVASAVLLLIADLLPLPALAMQSRQPPLRPPAWHRRPYLLPPSHAPPFAA
jgi:hypothetical protein